MGRYLTLRQWGKCIRGCGLYKNKSKYYYDMVLFCTGNNFNSTTACNKIIAEQKASQIIRLFVISVCMYVCACVRVRIIFRQGQQPSFYLILSGSGMPIKQVSLLQREGGQVVPWGP